MQTKPILPNPALDQKLAYTPAIEVIDATRTLYISGQVGVARDGTIPTDFAEQCRLVWANIEAVLAEAGMTMANLVKLSNFLVSADDFAQFTQVRTGFLGSHKPTSTLLIVAGLAKPEWKVEVEAIAVA
jgi:2-iminobutanoate/2-iminopropanoate deaminase